MRLHKQIGCFLIHNWGLILVFLISLLPLTWFKGEAIISTYDTNMYLNPLIYVQKFSTFWSVDNLGSYNLGIQFIFPLGILWKILNSFGLAFNDIQKIYFVVFYWLIPGVSMFFLMQKLFHWEDKLKANIAGVLAAALYLVNPYSMLTEFAIDMAIHLAYAFMPLGFLIFICGLKDLNRSARYAIAYALSLFLFAYITTHIPALVITLLPIFLYLIFFSLTVRPKKKLILLYLFKIGLFSFLLNAWSLLGFIHNTFFSYVGFIESVMRKGVLYYMAEIPEIVRMLGHWMFKHHLYEVEIPYVPYHQTYYSFPFIFLTYLIPVIIFSSLLFAKKNKTIFFFGALAVLSIFFAKGGNEPLGSLFVFLFDYFPLFWIFRDPFAKFILLVCFSYAILFSIASVFLMEWIEKLLKLKKRKAFKVIFFFASLLLIFGNAYPHFTDQVIRDYDYKKVRRGHVIVPDYWLQLRDYLQANDPEGRLFVLTKIGYASPMKWDLGFNGNPAPILLPNEIVSYSEGNPFLYFIYENISPDGENKIFLPMMQLLNLKYVLLTNDVDYQYDDYGGKVVHSPDEYQKIIGKEGYLKHLKTFGQYEE